MSIEIQPEVHDSDVERDGMWCGACGDYHAGDCNEEHDFDEDEPSAEEERMQDEMDRRQG